MENQVQTLEPNEEEVTQLIKKIRSLSKEGLFKVFGGTIREQQKTIEKLKPKADFFDRVTKTAKLLDLSKCAKILNYRGIGRNNLFAVLRDIGILQYNNEPYQKYINIYYFCVKEKEYEVQPGYTKVYAQTFVTQKGLDFIRRKLEEYGFAYNDNDN